MGPEATRPPNPAQQQPRASAAPGRTTETTNSCPSLPSPSCRLLLVGLGTPVLPLGDHREEADRSSGSATPLGKGGQLVWRPGVAGVTGWGEDVCSVGGPGWSQGGEGSTAEDPRQRPACQAGVSLWAHQWRPNRPHGCGGPSLMPAPPQHHPRKGGGALSLRLRGKTQSGPWPPSGHRQLSEPLPTNQCQPWAPHTSLAHCVWVLLLGHPRHGPGPRALCHRPLGGALGQPFQGFWGARFPRSSGSS